MYMFMFVFKLMFLFMFILYEHEYEHGMDENNDLGMSLDKDIDGLCSVLVSMSLPIFKHTIFELMYVYMFLHIQ
jgi:hypothetical protein